MGAVDGHSTGDFDKDKMISVEIINAFVISAGIDTRASWEHLTLMQKKVAFFKIGMICQKIEYHYFNNRSKIKFLVPVFLN